ncbi:MAG: hypothetical protein K0Q74_271 [Gammaproteobacteria bacterium]|jgi:hypothetical protein|nr:hypothetical protein [Gammaproteobacteria bacterium]
MHKKLAISMEHLVELYVLPENLEIDYQEMAKHEKREKAANE